MKVEKAKIEDVKQMHGLVNMFANKGEMLPRALSEIYENLRDYFVIRDKTGKVKACVALHISWADLAEVKALAVAEDSHRKGMGAALVKECVGEADSLGIPRVFCLTYKPGFFKKQGFKLVEKTELPRKIWAECYSCPKFPDCDEVALVYDIPAGK
ncbi:MAG: N-acetyltransferase [Dehalococcoidia bacterium]|nr:N-acetyltransferase [Dehalococcoidia bacterium]MDD5493926.1 N-acetyltransferase [Dehalococcoidia bacterium]